MTCFPVLSVNLKGKCCSEIGHFPSRAIVAKHIYRVAGLFTLSLVPQTCALVTGVNTRGDFVV